MLALVILMAIFGYLIHALNLLPLEIEYSILALLCVVALIFLVLFIRARKVLWRTILCLVCALLTAAFGVGDVYVFKTHNMLDIVSRNDEVSENKVSLYVLSEAGIENAEQLQDQSIGFFLRTDPEGEKKIKSELKAKGVTNYEKKDYESLPQLVKALYEGEIQAIVLDDAYAASVDDLDSYPNFKQDSKSILTVKYQTENLNSAKMVSDITKEPFTILISGNDTEGEIDQLSRSDVNMLVTVNPATHVVLMTSLPRDTYTPIYCTPETACIYGQNDKLTHSGLTGINTTKETIEKLLDVEINYTIRVNFTSVIDVVNALGGVDVEIEPGLAIEKFWTDHGRGVTEGKNHLDGRGALALARERYQYEDGDYQRIRNQRIVLKAILDKAMSPELLVRYASLMDSFANAFETNLTKGEITDLVKYQLKDNPKWKFYEYSIVGSGEMLFSPELGDIASVQVPSEYSIEKARKYIDEVIDGKKPKIKADDVQPEEEQPVEDITGGEVIQDPNSEIDPEFSYDPSQEQDIVYWGY